MAKEKLTLERRLHPEYEAGQFSARDCTVAFYTRIDALIAPSMTLLNLGAGRGANISTDSSPYRRKVQTFKGRVDKVVGVDLDPIVLKNEFLDESFIMSSDGKIPLEDASVELIVCDHVLEHVENPLALSDEISRVLKPGGWFCARTPVKWGYIGIGARALPNALHVSLLRRLQPGRREVDVFPTVYRLNTKSALLQNFPRAAWKHCTYVFNGVPSYAAENIILFRIIEFWNWITPKSMGAKFHIFLQKI